MEQRKTVRVHTVAEFHRLRGLPKPLHPLISIIDYASMERAAGIEEINWIFDFYQISVKRGIEGIFKYGQQEYKYDSDEGIMFFIAPGQVFNIQGSVHPSVKRAGWILLVHPDFLWNTSLARTIKKYEFFDYSVNEALLLSSKEEKTINGIIENIREEYNANIDKFSKQIIISHLETLLNYSERFYNRQFITREKGNHELLGRMEKVLGDYFNNDTVATVGLPTVQYIADTLCVSPKYLGSLLKQLTGKSTQQHIQDKIIEKAKEKLSTTNLTVSEIAYELGFEYAQSFSKLFRAKTKLSPLEFRQAFN